MSLEVTEELIARQSSEAQAIVPCGTTAAGSFQAAARVRLRG